MASKRKESGPVHRADEAGMQAYFGTGDYETGDWGRDSGFLEPVLEWLIGFELEQR